MKKGQIIHKTIENKSVKIYDVRLALEEIQETIRTLVPSDNIYDVQEYISASGATDQPTNILVLNLQKEKAIRVYGRLNKDSEDRRNVSDDFLLVFDNLKKYTNKSEEEWLPNKIEVMFWDYDYAPTKRPWIRNFPDLNSPTTIKFDNNSYSVFIDKKDFDEFKKYFKSMGEKEAVEINGRKMAISYRLPFPNIN